MLAVRHLFLIVVTLHAQMPCGLVQHAFCSGDLTTQNRDGDTAPRPAQTGCPCCQRHVTTERDTIPTPEPRPACPVDCPCMFCSVGFVPLTDFAMAARGPDQAVEPLVYAAIPADLAGHPAFLDRPPRPS